MTCLIITADDLGIDARRDAGIAFAFAKNAVSQASLLVGGASAKSAAALARQIGLPLGLHLDLTEMPASAETQKIPTLLDATSHKLGKHGLRQAIAEGRVDPDDLANEIRAQLNHFEALVGTRPTHVDGHQHAHCIPAIVDTIARVLSQGGVKTTRIPEQSPAKLSGPAVAFYRQVIADGVQARAIYARYGIRSSEAFIGLQTLGEAMSKEALVEAFLENRAAASVELMCHPGYAGTGVDDFNRSSAREHELSILCAGPFDTFVARERLLSFAAADARGALRPQ